jgi:hypothetical protein
MRASDWIRVLVFMTSAIKNSFQGSSLMADTMGIQIYGLTRSFLSSHGGFFHGADSTSAARLERQTIEAGSIIKVLRFRRMSFLEDQILQ